MRKLAAKGRFLAWGFDQQQEEISAKVMRGKRPADDGVARRGQGKDTSTQRALGAGEVINRLAARELGKAVASATVTGKRRGKAAAWLCRDRRQQGRGRAVSGDLALGQAVKRRAGRSLRQREREKGRVRWGGLMSGGLSQRRETRVKTVARGWKRWSAVLLRVRGRARGHAGRYAEGRSSGKKGWRVTVAREVRKGGGGRGLGRKKEGQVLCKAWPCCLGLSAREILKEERIAWGAVARARGLGEMARVRCRARERRGKRRRLCDWG